jgi:membrane protease YdiL (CAAX protease family)
MFNRYWRTYPWALQMVLFFLMIFTLMSFATFLVLTFMPRLSGVSINDIINLSPASSVKTTRVTLIAQAISHICSFAVPALLFATFTHPRMREYLGLRKPANPIHWLLVTGIMLGLIPALLWGEAWMMHHLHFGKLADETQQKSDNMIKAFLNLPTGADFALLLTVLALLPALGEELIFRGIFLRLFHRGFNRARLSAQGSYAVPVSDPQRAMVFPVILSALLFATWHTNPYGFTMIFIAGCVLALIYSLTGSLLCSMWAHLLYNGLQVSIVYFSHGNVEAKKIAEGENLPIVFPIAGLILFAISFYALVRTQSPLKPDWSNDFRSGEPESEKQE